MEKFDAIDVLCTVPLLDLLDLIWSVNLTSLLLASTVNIYLLYRLYSMHFSDFQVN